MPMEHNILLGQVPRPVSGLYDLRAITADNIHFGNTLRLDSVRKGAVGSVISGKLHGTDIIKF